MKALLICLAKFCFVINMDDFFLECVRYLNKQSARVASQTFYNTSVPYHSSVSVITKVVKSLQNKVSLNFKEVG